MQLSKKEMDSLKIKFALTGVGSKKKCSEATGVHQTAISRILKFGDVTEDNYKKILKWLK